MAYAIKFKRRLWDAVGAASYALHQYRQTLWGERYFKGNM